MLPDEGKTKEQLISELAEMRQRVAELGRAEAERIQMTKQLRASEQRYQDLYEEAPVAYFSVDTTGRISMANHGAEELLGYRLYELIGKPVIDLYADTAAGKPKAREIFQRFVTGEQIQNEELEMVKKDGSRAWISLSVRPIKDAKGKVLASRLIVLDITERKRAEETIYKQNEFLNSVLDSLTYPFYVVDANDYMIKMANAAVKLGDLAKNPTCYQLTHKNSQPCGDVGYVCPLEEVKKTKKPVVVEHIHYDVDGNARNVEVHGYPIFDSEGNVIQMIEYCLDITERKRVEEEIEKLARFPSEDPHPVLRVAKDGTILYANTAGLPLLNTWGCTVGQLLPHYWRRFTLGVLNSGLSKNTDIECGFRVFSLTFAPVVDAGYVNLYGLDITERKRAREALQRSEEKLRLMFESVAEGIIVSDLNGNTIQVNDATLRLHGYESKEELIGRSAFEFIAEKDHARATENLKRTLKEGYVKNVEYTLLTRDGREFLAELSAAVLRDMSGSPIGLVTITRDITERKRAEGVLRESEGKYKLLFENTLDGVFVIDAKTMKIVLANQAAAKIYGFDSAEDAVGTKPLDFVPPEDRERVIRIIAEDMFAKDLRQVNEFRTITKDGREVWISALGIRTEYQGRLAGLVTIRDITERRQAEEALERQKAYFQQLFDNSPDAIAMLDDTDRVVQVNKGFETLFGYRAEEVKGRFINDIVVPEDRIEEASALSRAALNGEVSRIETVRKRKDGSLVDVSLLHYPIQFGNKTVAVYAIYSDITERKRAEEEIRKVQERFSGMYNSSKDAIGFASLDGVLLDVNDSFCQLTGYSKEELVTRKYQDITPKEYEEYEAKMIESIVTTGKPAEYEKEYIRKDGSRVPISLTVFVVKDPDGKPIGVAAIIKDITERKRVEEALQESEEKYRHLFDDLNDAAFLADVETGLIVETNRRGTVMLGRSRDEIVGMHQSELHPPGQADKYRQKFATHIQKGHAADYDGEVIRKDGTIVLVTISASALTIRGRRLILGLFRDITERKRAEEALRESEEKYKGLVNNVKLGVFRSTPEPTGKFLEVNPAMEELTGYRRKELLRMNVADLYVYPEERGAVLEEVASGAGKAAKELHLRKKDGTEIVVSDTKVAVRDGNGQIVYFDGIMEDVTERKRAEEREKQLQEELYLSSRLASIGELAAGVAHELNNPLTGIIGFSQRLLRKNTDETLNRDLERIHNEARRAAKVVQNLLTFARRHEAKKEYSDINEILGRALELRAYELRTSNIELAVELASGLPQVMADFGQLQEVFLNITLNAEQAITEANRGGKLSVKTQKVKNYIKIRFTDDGPGVPAEHLGKVFDPFFTTRGERGGTGLGLSLCHGIVTEHGGRIYAKSKLGKGAAFTVELPLTTE